jgi:hypothetical protein
MSLAEDVAREAAARALVAKIHAVIQETLPRGTLDFDTPARCAFTLACMYLTTYKGMSVADARPVAIAEIERAFTLISEVADRGH